MSIKSTVTIGILACLVSSFVMAAPLSSVVVFGDSLSDTGLAYNAILASRQEMVPPPPYFEGRFSNGPVAVEVMAEQLGLPLQSLAYGGAKTGTANILNSGGDLDQTGVQDQIDRYIQGGLDPHALLVLWAGTNDLIISANLTTVQTAVSNLALGLNKLAQAGGRHFFLPALPDLSTMPMLLGRQRFQDLSVSFNTGLHEAAQTFLSTHPDVELQWFETPQVLDGMKQSEAFAGGSVTQACIAGDFYAVESVCAAPERFMFWDQTHFSATTHAALGVAFAAAVVPEPSSQTLYSLGLLVVMVTTLARSRQFGVKVRSRTAL